MSRQLLGPIGQVALRVHDTAAAVEYYRDRLGLPLLFEAGGMAFFDCHGVRLLLGRPDAPEHDHPGSILYFRVTDIRAVHERLVARDVAFIEPPRAVAELESADLWLAFLRDPWDNVLALMEEVPRRSS